ncbi:MAG: SDR family oxidoreductase [Chloroflexi bacterium]|nr:SDR family oxidoreductase [Chloroflexota bacterium]
MKGKVCLITGATSGVGRATASELAEMGAAVIGVGRDSIKCTDVSSEIRNSSGNPNVEFLVADLSNQDQVRQLVRDFEARFDRLDVLINNAGAFFLRRKLSPQGIEMTWALNHLNYFLLTNLLLEQIKASPQARIVNVASGAHYRGKIHFNDLNLEKGYNGWKAYCQSKLANVLFTYELVRRLDDQGVTVNSLTPGFVATRIGHNTGPVLKYLVSLVQKLGGKTPEEGAETITYLASSSFVHGITGKFFIDKKAVNSSPISYDQEIAQRLWEISELMTRG